ncbi:MAG: MarR family transcriptional regulator [Desulfitobacteriaceae bacterium]|nr:MarR family transcriptional regulator [Desulfitobacteriaceae bacterium]
MVATNCCFEEIFCILRSIQVSINDHLKANAQNYGLNMTEFIILFELDYHEGISLNELSKMLELSKSSVSRIVDQLVNKGFVLRIIPPENRRMVNLYLNRDYLKSREATDFQKELNKLLKDLEPDKARRIVSALRELQQFLNSKGKFYTTS